MQRSEILVLGSLLAWGIVSVLRVGRRRRGLPPGPRTVPLFGNALLLADGKDLHLKLTDLARSYGDIFSLEIMTMTMIVLSSPTAIKEVVDKHGWAASSRPGNYIAEICGSGGDVDLVFAADSPRLQNIRRVVARFFSPQNSLRYVPAETAESTVLLNDLITQPAAFSDSIRRYTHSLAKIMAYGQRAPSFHSEEVQEFYTTLDQLLHALGFGTYPPFDLIPALKWIPPPFAPWRAVGVQIKSVRNAIHTRMYEGVRRRQAAGDVESTECFIGKVLQSKIPEGDEEAYSRCSHTGLALLDAGSDTSAAFLLSLVLVLATYPECQERARAEIDAVVDGMRLPVSEDFPKLPYLNALIKEVMRFRPQFPIGIPHLMTGNAVYKEYHVPKDSMVVLNTYALFHDPEIFEEPEVFNPDRFLKSEHGTRPAVDNTDFRDNFLFGGGRRICPGQWVAQSTMHLTSMRLIWALKFGAATDPSTGQPLSRELDFYASEGAVVMPKPFNCVIEPRSQEHRDAVVQELVDANFFLSRYEGN
ncbi:cytochrome P450 [Mycena maculata]|uniref:Cytochrome P450 n=1 Tax=Mycena maculata TaxID=230809 RepID=A0AAD7NLP3_9AGAR|nr:cytochrome P450 [Mycena maculata]